MAVTITHSTPADGTFSATGAAAWDATHTVSGLGTMAEQNANNVNITGGSITGVTGVLSSLTVNSTPTSGGAAGQIMFDTGSVLQESSNFVWNNANGGLTVSSIANPTIPSLTINGASNYTGATLSGVQITGTGGQFSCNATTLTVGEFVTISGTLGGTGSITGYSNPTTYRISATNGTTTFTLVNATNGAAIVTTSGTPTGLTYTVTDPFINLSQTWNNSVVAFRGLRYNVTDTASNASSLLMDLQVFGSSRFRVDKNGSLLIPANASSITLGAGNNNSAVFAGVQNTGATFSVAGAFIFGYSSSEYGLGIQLRNNSALSWSSTTSFSATASIDLFLTRRGAANLRFGAADAAAPVAQTLSVQSVVAGTSNTAGANLTITGSQGTGTGAGGSIIFQVAPAGTTGTAQNALSTALTIASDRSATFTGAINAASSSSGGINLQNNTSIYTNAGNSLLLILGAGTFTFSRETVATGALCLDRPFQVRDTATFSWSSTSAGNGAADLTLRRRAAANLQLGNADAAAPVAQTLSVQSVVAGTSNTAGANFTITGSQGTGTGAGGDIIFQTADVGASGTAQNTLVTALRIYSNQTVAVGKAYTVATLPAAGTQGRRAWVTDATAPTFLGALTGGGAVVCPVFDNGTAWVAG